MPLFDILKLRKSAYDLTNESTLGQPELEALLAHALELSPTGFNSQSGRIVLAIGTSHDIVWDSVIAGIEREIGGTPAFEKSKEKIATLRRSAGTILFYEDTRVTDDLKNRFPLYANNIATWAEQSQGMLQFAVWAALAEAGMGASLQHYTELIDLVLKDKLAIDPSWRLVGQMPFGKKRSEPAIKEKKPGASRLVVKK